MNHLKPSWIAMALKHCWICVPNDFLSNNWRTCPIQMSFCLHSSKNNQFRNDFKSKLFFFTGIWSTVDILTLLGLNTNTELELVTELSQSNTTHPLLQTVAEGRADFAPYEFGVTHNRNKFLGKSFCAILGGISERGHSNIT